MILRAALLICAVLASGSLPVRAQPQGEVASADMLQGWRTDSGSIMMALRLRLAPGWKTYWRSPGEAGIPPTFDWSGSDNLGQIRLFWPRPVVFLTSGMTSIGYHDEVVLPFEVVAADPGRPVRLGLQVDLGVCKDICLPVTLAIAGDVLGTGQDSDIIRAALADRPVPAASAGLTGIACDVAPIEDGVRVTARVDMPPLGLDETVVFEAGSPDIWVATSQSDRRGERLTSAADMVAGTGLPFALDRSGVVLTIISGATAVEIKGCPAGQ
ncbi:MAG: protein-disulfide reductase DsbD domain-containing protein [Pseudomonadota bacterium]